MPRHSPCALSSLTFQNGTRRPILELRFLFCSISLFNGQISVKIPYGIFQLARRSRALQYRTVKHITDMFYHVRLVLLSDLSIM